MGYIIHHLQSAIGLKQLLWFYDTFNVIVLNSYIQKVIANIKKT